MNRLDARDVSALLAFTDELKGLDDPLPVPPRLLAGLNRLIPSSDVGYSVLDPSRRTSTLQVWHSSGGDEYVDVDEHALYDQWWGVRHTHPVCGYRARTNDWTTPLKASDFIDLRAFRRTPIYDAFYRGVLDHWFDFGFPPTPTRTRVFIFRRRGGPDFDERDRLVAELLRPYLEERVALVETVSRAAEALGAVEEGAGEGPQSVVLCSANGVIEFASRSSRGLLKRYLGIDNGRLPTSLLVGPRTVYDGEQGRLTIRVARAGALCVLLLGEEDTRVDRLTQREREILELVAAGRENDAIALELGIATATVAKHLERVYAKLSVPNRTAAAALVLSRSAPPAD